ncbi:MAG TPA: HD-GYP domain-containing protein [Treponemataceae bacterium]|nr:HD-GYP domain-containing protein [Treponemataceae bacterium]
MTIADLFENNDQKLNKAIALGMRVIFYFIFILWIVLALKIEGYVLSLYSGIFLFLCFLLVLPTIFFHLFKLRNTFVKYSILTSAVICCGLLYTYFHSSRFMMFAFPVVISALYFKPSVSVYTIVITLLIMTASCIISYMSFGFASVSYSSFSDMVIGDLLPQTIQFLLFSFIMIILTTTVSKLFEKVFRSNTGLDNVIKHLVRIFSARTYQEISHHILSAVRDVAQSASPSSYAMAGGCCGIRISPGSFYVFKSTGRSSIENIIDNALEVTTRGQVFTFAVNDGEKTAKQKFTIDCGILIMHFYDAIRENELAGFLVLPVSQDCDPDLLLKMIDLMYQNIQIALCKMSLANDLYITQEELVRAFAELSESKSRQTGQHIKRVSEYMQIMASALNLEEEEKKSLCIASMMHDIGKLLIPEEILEKPSKLTADEFTIIKKHVVYGYELLKNSPGRVMEIAQTIALEHHEKWDGSGYLGKKAEEIDLYSRLMAVADVYDALVSRRSYKEKWEPKDAYNEIVKGSGSHFDPMIVGIFEKKYTEFFSVVQKYPDSPQDEDLRNTENLPFVEKKSMYKIIEEKTPDGSF